MVYAKQPETKSWSEIKLRNPNSLICKEMELIMQDKRQVSASKALEYYIQDYSVTKAQISKLQAVTIKLRDELETKEEEVQVYKDKLKRISQYYDGFRNELATDVDIKPGEKPQTRISSYAITGEAFAT
jgi:uncharacterized phage infection (PIP) family protein YhgE